MVKAVLLSFNIITKVTITIFNFLSLSIASFAMISSNSEGYELFIVFAQMEKDKDTNQKMVDTQSVNSTSKTFSVIGTISSLVMTVPQHEFNITNVFKVILTGDWVLNVRNGTVINFETNFLASPMDGSMGHIHQITNFSENEEARDMIIYLHQIVIATIYQ